MTQQTHPSVEPVEPIGSEQRQKSPLKSLIASTSGQLLEWYEWSVYAVFAPFISQVMFNPDNPVSGLLSTLAVFAVGFLMRPLGGVVFGALADKAGRKVVLITTMLTMAAASIFIGVMPTYDSIGIWASVALLLARCVQGFAHGGESAAANSYVAEIAPPRRRGQWSSLVFVTIFGGSVLAYALGGGITHVLDDSAVAQWGWRIPFLLAAVLALAALWLRTGMQESAVHDERKEAEVAQNQAAPAPNVDASVTVQVTPVKAPMSQVKGVLLIIAMVSGITCAHYTWTSYVSTYAISEQGMDPQATYWVTVAAQLIALVSLPFWGRFSDRVGRKPVLVIFGIAMAITQFPLMGLISDKPWTLFVATVVALLIVSAGGALLSCVMSEVFPTKSRTRNIGLAYSISVAVFGGSAPYLNQLFISWDMAWLSNLFIVVLCAVTLLAVWRLPETKGVDLNSVK